MLVLTASSLPDFGCDDDDDPLSPVNWSPPAPPTICVTPEDRSLIHATTVQVTAEITPPGLDAWSLDGIDLGAPAEEAEATQTDACEGSQRNATTTYTAATQAIAPGVHEISATSSFEVIPPAVITNPYDSVTIETSTFFVPEDSDQDLMIRFLDDSVTVVAGESFAVADLWVATPAPSPGFTDLTTRVPTDLRLVIPSSFYGSGTFPVEVSALADALVGTYTVGVSAFDLDTNETRMTSLQVVVEAPGSATSTDGVGESEGGLSVGEESEDGAPVVPLDPEEPAGGSAADPDPPQIIDINGTWRIRIEPQSEQCGPEPPYTREIEIEQRGSELTVTGLNGAMPVWEGTLAGMVVTFGGRRDENGGTTDAAFELTLSEDLDQLEGTETWSWDRDNNPANGVTCDDGTSPTMAERL